MKNIKKGLLYLLCLDIVILLVVAYHVFGKNDHIKNSSNIVVEEENQTSKKVALTFDDGPNCEYTKIILDGLKERNVKATFFLIGKNIEGNEELVKRMSEEGHLIGNHTYSHVRLKQLSKKQALIEIFKENRIIYKITGVPVKYIRPPFGEWNEALSKATNLEVVMWDVDPRDWCTNDTTYVVNHVITHVEDGYIILLHDCYDTSVSAALEIVDQLKEEGYEFVTIDKLLDK